MDLCVRYQSARNEVEFEFIENAIRYLMEIEISSRDL